jgi:hypothetical protein
MKILKLPAEAIAQIAEDTRNGIADQFGVCQIELYHNAEGQVYCRLTGQTKKPSAGTTAHWECPVSALS